MAIEEVEAENAAVRAQNTALMACIHQLEGQLGKDSHNNDKPLSGAGLVRHLLRTCCLRRRSGNKPGAHPGHRGTMLELVETPDAVEINHLAICAYCRSLPERHSSRADRAPVGA